MMRSAEGMGSYHVWPPGAGRVAGQDGIADEPFLPQQNILRLHVSLIFVNRDLSCKFFQALLSDPN